MRSAGPERTGDIFVMWVALGRGLEAKLIESQAGEPRISELKTAREILVETFRCQARPGGARFLCL
jgi:hypothetical protein